MPDRQANDLTRHNTLYIACKRVIDREVLCIGLTAEFVDFTGVNAQTAGRFESHPHTTDAGKKIDESDLGNRAPHGIEQTWLDSATGPNKPFESMNHSPF